MAQQQVPSISSKHGLLRPPHGIHPPALAGLAIPILGPGRPEFPSNNASTESVTSRALAPSKQLATSPVMLRRAWISPVSPRRTNRMKAVRAILKTTSRRLARRRMNASGALGTRATRISRRSWASAAGWGLKAPAAAESATLLYATAIPSARPWAELL